jgi:hypothetical protein
MSDTVREILARLRAADEPQLSAFLPDSEGQNTILRNLPCALIVRDAEEGIILELNDYALDLFGVQRFNIIGKTLGQMNAAIEIKTETTLTAPGKPALGHIKDTCGVSVPVLILQRRIRISERNVDVILAIDSTLLGGSRAAEVSFNLFKRALAESGTAFIFARITGDAMARDLLVSETGGELPSEIKEKALQGSSVSDLFSPVNAARIVENAIILSRNGGEKKLELKKSTSLKMFADPGGQVLITFPVESVEKKTVRTKTSELSSGVRRAVLHIASGETEQSSGKEMLQMIGFQVIQVDSPSSAHIILEESPGRFHFVVCEGFTDDPDLMNVASELENSGLGLVLVTQDDFNYSGNLKIVKISPPLSINLLASAVSQVSE